MKSLNADQLEKAFIMFSDRYNELYGYDTSNDIASVKDEPKVKATQKHRNEVKQDTGRDDFEKLTSQDKNSLKDEKNDEQNPKRRSTRTASVASSTSIHKRKRRKTSSHSVFSEEEQKNEDPYDNEDDDGGLFGTGDDSEEEEKKENDESKCFQIQEGIAPFHYYPANMEKVYKRKKGGRH
jgi:hypothetical protein